MSDDPSGNPLARILEFDRISLRAVVVEDGEDPGPALAAAGIFEPIALPVVFGDDQPAAGFGDGITPNLMAVLESGSADRFGPGQGSGDTAPGRVASPAATRFGAAGSAPDGTRGSAPVNLPARYGQRPLAPVGRPGSASRIARRGAVLPPVPGGGVFAPKGSGPGRTAPPQPASPARTGQSSGRNASPGALIALAERLFLGLRHVRDSSAMKPAPVKLSDLMVAFDVANTESGERAYLDLETGKTYFVGGWVDEDDPPPEDLEESDRYLALPERSELRLGRRVALDFVEEVAPDDFDLVRGFFSRSGAFARFKGFLAARGLLDRWSNYETAAEERAVRQWCEAHEIPVIED